LTPEVRLGEVVEFDDPRGLGEVRDAGSGERFPFHCTEIADGTRRVVVGTAVAFVLRTGRLGPEARSLVKLEG
jgi:cold shock CspA family protein